MTQTVWISRHGNRQDFVDPAFKSKDPPLSEDGVVQARETGTRLKDEGISHIFSSPFLRTVQTAHHIAEALDLPVRIEPGACEWLNPEWFTAMPEFISLGNLRERYPRIDPDYKPLVTPVFPETKQEKDERCFRTIRLLADTYPSDILVVGHGASVVAMTHGLVKNIHGVRCSMCALVKIRRTGGEATLELNGDVSHLSGGEVHRNKLV